MGKTYKDRRVRQLEQEQSSVKVFKDKYQREKNKKVTLEDDSEAD